MRIAIDTNPLYTTQAGMARYVRSLLGAFHKYCARELEIVEVGWPVGNFGIQQPQRALKTAYRELIWAKWIAPEIIAKSRAGAYHITGTPLTFAPNGIPNVVTVHDMAVFRQPDRFRRWHGFSARSGYRKLHRARHVICISGFTADEVSAVLGLSERDISVVYYGCPFHPNDPAPPERKPDFDVPPEFLLFVSSLEPGKNITLIREMYELAESRRVKLPPLLLAGSRWQGVGHEGPPPSGWRFLGHQSDDVLVYLYRRAQALLFPSKYEGFGLPVAEAQALGCPVICSPVASLPEVGGTAALYAEMNARAYLETILRLTAEPELRQEAIDGGKAQAAKFSWQRCARETLEIYRLVGTD